MGEKMMYLFYLSIYSYVLWLLMLLINYLFLSLSFTFEMSIMLVLNIVIGWLISLIFTYIIPYIHIDRWWLSLAAAILLLGLEAVSGWFVMNTFIYFTLFLANFLYSFVITSSLSKKNLV